MKILITLLKPFSFAPAILMMCVIYSFSAQTGEVSGALSYKVSYQIVETKNEILASDKSPDQLSQEASGIEFYVRKAAHMTEYCLLAISISFPLYVYGVRGIWLMLLAGFVCVGFAGLDEYHQSFVNARGSSVRDVGIDSCGALIGILLVQAFCWSTLHTPGRKKSRKKTSKKSKTQISQVRQNIYFPLAVLHPIYATQLTQSKTEHPRKKYFFPPDVPFFMFICIIFWQALSCI